MSQPTAKTTEQINDQDDQQREGAAATTGKKKEQEEVHVPAENNASQ